MNFINYRLFHPQDNASSCIEIQTKRRIYDLHNAAEFKAFSYDLRSNTVRLDWYLYDHKGAVKSFLLSLTFESPETIEFNLMVKQSQTDADIVRNIALLEQNSALSIEFESGNHILLRSTYTILSFSRLTRKVAPKP